jgi:hybrid cluster-associated redox disulfide protein
MFIGPQSLVGSLMEERPETLSVFLRNRMHCPGCVMARFTTVAEAAANYRLDPHELAAELRATAGGVASGAAGGVAEGAAGGVAGAAP